VPEMVFLLGRMGNNKKALTLIIERLGDVSRVSILFLPILYVSELLSNIRLLTLRRSKMMMTSGKIF
jgi:hypothetical protein